MFFKRSKLDNIDKDSIFSSEEIFRLIDGKTENFKKVLTAGCNGNLSCQVYISEVDEMYLHKFKNEVSSTELNVVKERFVKYATMSANQGHKASKDRLFLFYSNQVNESQGEVTKKDIEYLEEAKYWYEQSNGISESDEILDSINDSIRNLYRNADDKVRQEIIGLRLENCAQLSFKRLNDDTNNIIDYEHVFSHAFNTFSALTKEQILETRFSILSAFCLVSSAAGAKDEGDIVFLEILLRVLHSLLRYLVSVPQGSYNNTEIEFLEVTTIEFNKLNTSSL